MNVPEEQLARQELATGPQQLDRIGLLSALALGSWGLANYWEAAFSFTLVILAFVVSRSRASKRAPFRQLRSVLTLCLWVFVVASFFRGLRP